jgi:hypothetical protein
MQRRHLDQVDIGETKVSSLDSASRLALDLASLDLTSIVALSGGDEIASLTSGHAVADMSASCCCETSSCCTCVA